MPSHRQPKSKAVMKDQIWCKLLVLEHLDKSRIEVYVKFDEWVDE